MTHPQRSDSTEAPSAPTMLLMVGLPGAGKTTGAIELAATNRRFG
ncbi:MAG: hypothetical protein QM619_12105 [Micropruina sp.]